VPAHRILHVIANLDRAGAPKQLGLLVRGLPRHEFESHVCALAGGPQAAGLAEAGVPVTVVGQRWPLDPAVWWRLRRCVGRTRPEVLHTWGGAANAYGGLATGAGKPPRIVSSQRCNPHCKSAVARALDRYATRRSHAVVVNSAAVQEWCVRNGVPAEKIRTVPNGVATASEPLVGRRQRLAELRIPANSRLVGLIGALLPSKRVKDAVWAADLLKVVRDDVHLLVFGDGPQRERLVRYRDQVEIRDKVHFLGDRGDVGQWMPHLDLLWSTSAWESHSNAIMEALACGVPVVATDIPGTRDLVVHETTGYLVKVGHRAGFARWTNHLLDHPDLARQLGQAGRERMASEFRVETMVDQYAELYRELLSTSTPKA